MRPAFALIDSGCDTLLLNQLWAKEHQLEPIEAPRSVKSIDGHRIPFYGRHRIEIDATDFRDVTKSTTQTFNAVGMTKYDAILGIPWLKKVNPLINWRDETWAHREGRIGEDIEIIPEKKVKRSLQKGKSVFMVHIYDAEEITVRATTAEHGRTLPIQYEGYEDVFSEELAGEIPAHAAHDYKIELLSNTQPPYRPIYNLSEKELKVLREYIHAALEKGWIRPSTSPTGAPILFVPKKDGSLRLCVDYRGLNEVTVRDRYPLPLVNEILDRLSGAKIYTKLDLRDAYHRIRIRKGDEWKTAFRTRYGQFEYRVMPFGLANAPVTFQAYINRALAPMLDVYAIVYLDDILIFSEGEEQHVEHVKTVFERLRKFQLYAKASKCEFYTRKVEYLGFIVTPTGIEMDPKRVELI